MKIINYNSGRNMYILILLIAFFSCKNEQVNPETNTKEPMNAMTASQANANTDNEAEFNVPDACTLITNDEVKGVFHVKSNVASLDISSGLKPNTKTCNFYWDGESSPMNIIIQIQSHSDTGVSATAYVENLIKNGMAINGFDDRLKFTSFDAGEKSGAFSFEQRRCFWAGNDSYSFMVVFNNSNPNEQENKEMLSNLAKVLNKNLAKL